jgi:hypothetical protein
MVEPQPRSHEEGKEAGAVAALKIYVDLINSERQAIWARTAAMLVANSFILNAIRFQPGKVEAAGVGLNPFFGYAGLFLCLLWGIMTWHGWTYFHKCIVEGSRLPVDPCYNPLTKIKVIDRRSDTIFICTMLAVVTFVAMYVVTLVQFYQLW